MPRMCAVLNCDNKYSTTPGVSLHAFLKDQHLSSIWKSACSSTIDNAKLQNYGVCSTHFSIDCYRDPKFPKAGAGVRRLLSEFSCPTERIPLSTEQQVEIGTVTAVLKKLREFEMKLEISSNKLIEAEKEISTLKLQINRGQLERQELNEKLEKIMKKSEITKKMSEQVQNKTIEKQVRSRIEDILSSMFTKTQVNILITKSRRVWNEEDMSMALSLYSVSARAYVYLRNTCNFPLPTKSVLLKWSSRIRISPDILAPVMEVLKVNFLNSTPMERQCSLCFDEISLDENVCFDEREQLIYGPCKKMVAVFVRGLFSPWKQLIYYEFDVKLTPHLINVIITSLQNAGLNVKTLICDLDGGNRGLLSALGIDVKNGIFSFPNPCTGENVWCVADFCHLLKRLRDNFLDHYFILSDGTRIDTSTIENLLKVDKSELKLSFKVTHKHLTLRGKERMNVRTAFELFSNRVAKAIEFVRPQDKKIAEFFSLINNYSDLMNTHTSQKDANPYKCAFGMELEKQMALLEEVTSTISNMRVGDLTKKGNKKALMPFQKGVILTNNSLRNLFLEMKQSPVNAKFVMTSHINQDFAENGFSCFRGFNGYNFNPGPSEANSRIKSLIVSWTMLKPHSANVRFEESPKQLSCQNLKLLISSSSQPELRMPNDDLERLEKIDPEDFSTILRAADLTKSKSCERGGSEYIAGYIAKKMVSIHPELSDFRSSSNLQTGWISMLSNSGLTVPSDFWLNIFLKFEQYFKELNNVNGKLKLNRARGILSILEKYLSQQFPCISERAIKYFVRVRTMIRIRFVNKCIDDKKRNWCSWRRVNWLQSNDCDEENFNCNEGQPDTVESLDQEYQFMLEAEETFQVQPEVEDENELVVE